MPYESTQGKPRLFLAEGCRNQASQTRWYRSSVSKDAMDLERPTENKGKALCAEKGDRKARATLGKQQVDLCS